MAADAHGFIIPFPGNHHPDDILWAARRQAPKRKLTMTRASQQPFVFIIYEGPHELFSFAIDETVSQTEIIRRMEQP